MTEASKKHLSEMQLKVLHPSICPHNTSFSSNSPSTKPLISPAPQFYICRRLSIRRRIYTVNTLHLQTRVVEEYVAVLCTFIAQAVYEAPFPRRVRDHILRRLRFAHTHRLLL
ncbi:hypothetical protein SUGI_0812730 [Cryptomeria japonica]|nr:hypothetical protein SUGI_0812730 [Cryptomeria japonica]